MKRTWGSLIVAVAVLLPAASVGAGAGAGAGRTPRDPLLEMQWGLRSIDAVEAWRYSRGGGAQVVVLDSGIDGTHPDLDDQLSRKGWACSGKPASDRTGHGTHIAGIIAAETGNGEGVAGVAPRATLISVRRGGGCDYADTIRRAADLGPDVMNISQGYGPEGYVYGSAALLDDVKEAVSYAWRKGVVVVVSAGNSSQPLCAEPWLDVPVICVGAVNDEDLPSSYTNRDVALLSNYIVAPGGDGFCEEGIVSTYVRGGRGTIEEETCDLPPRYESLDGTSMAAPHVAGVAALLSASGLDNEEIVTCILSNTEDLGPTGRDPVFGFGKVNALAAVEACRR